MSLIITLDSKTDLIGGSERIANQIPQCNGEMSWVRLLRSR
ncbi:hypothetical protein [Leptolyngbya sp. NIES-2104]|nr:hypothetical protein [Leptolyngbya sp. NIES-2104]GAP93734.1 hypothetical protein NIES2104_02410 [Leptolyngbya sp. NIES-2104]